MEDVKSKNYGGEDIDNIKLFAKTISKLKNKDVDIEKIIDKMKHGFKELEINRMFLRAFSFIGESSIVEKLKDKEKIMDKDFVDVFKDDVVINHIAFSINLEKIMNIYKLNKDNMIMNIIGFVVDGVYSVYKDDMVYAKYVKDNEKNNMVNIKIGLDSNQLNKDILMKLIENVLNMYDQNMLWKNCTKIELSTFFKLEWIKEIKHAESMVINEKMKKLENKIEIRKNKILKSKI